MLPSKQQRRRRRQKAAATQDTMLLHDIRGLLQDNISTLPPLVEDVVVPPVRRQKVYTFEQSFTSTAVGNSVAEFDEAITFSLSSLGNAAAFESIFDQYRIVAARVQFIPNNARGLTGATSPIYTVIDYDDASIVPITSLVQYDTLKVSPAGGTFVRELRPKIAVSTYSGAFTSFGTSSTMWLDCASPNVLYYGVKLGIPAATNPASWFIICNVQIQFRNPR